MRTTFAPLAAARLMRLPFWSRSVKPGTCCPIRGGVARAPVAAAIGEDAADMPARRSNAKRVIRFIRGLCSRARSTRDAYRATWKERRSDEVLGVNILT